MPVTMILVLIVASRSRRRLGASWYDEARFSEEHRAIESGGGEARRVGPGRRPAAAPAPKAQFGTPYSDRGSQGPGGCVELGRLAASNPTQSSSWGHREVPTLHHKLYNVRSTSISSCRPVIPSLPFSTRVGTPNIRCWPHYAAAVSLRR